MIQVHQFLGQKKIKVNGQLFVKLLTKVLIVARHLVETKWDGDMV